MFCEIVLTDNHEGDDFVASATIRGEKYLGEADTKPDALRKLAEDIEQSED